MTVTESAARREVIDPDAPEIERLARDAIAASALYGAANVVMQLALLPVGRGVAESTVDSGRVDKHPYKRRGTTLQVSEEMWPADREAFYEYWWDAVREVRMDDVSRKYLSDLTNLRFFKRWYRRIFARNNRLLTIGFLPAEFRDELREPWSASDQRRFER